MHVPNGKANDGYGDPIDDTGSSYGTHYLVVTDGSFRIPLSLSASDTTAPDAGSQSAGSYASVGGVAINTYPVTINLTGTTPDSSGNQNILVGQGCTASVSGIPDALLNNTAHPPVYNWSVGGTTFQSWSATTPANPNATPPTPANANASSYVPGPGPLTNSTAYWFWNDPTNKSETITCTLTLTPPAGQGAAFNITATKVVSVQIPQWDAYGVGGRMKVNANAPHQNGAITLYAGPGVVGGMSLNADCFSSSPLGNGTLALMQLITPSASYVNTTGVGVPGANHPIPISGQGLDGVGAYAWSSVQQGDPDVGNFTPYRANDSPSLPLMSYMASATVQHYFVDYLMYQPPDNGSGTQFVPLATFNWSLNGSATNPGYWSDYVADDGSDTAGTVTPPVTTLFTPGNTFPAWTQIIGPTPLPWPVQSP